jgi:glucokinase
VSGEYWIGFDLGGTKMIAALLDDSLKVVSRLKERTGAQDGSRAVLKRIAATIEGLIAQSGVARDEIRGIGIAVPGPLDREAGILLNTPNLGFKRTPLRDYVEKETGFRAVLENDVNAGTYGEYIEGAGRGFRHIVGVFPGTGIGGGLILDGRLYRGAQGNAGEVGHMIIQLDGPQCGCGQYGCLEALASRLAISKDAVGLAASGKAPLTYREAGTDIKNYKSRVFARAWEKQESSIVELIKRSAGHLGVGLANCVNLLNPEAVILGGGLVEKLGKPYVHEAESSMRAHGMSGMVDDVKVLVAKLGDDAVFIGAAALARQEIEGR